MKPIFKYKEIMAALTMFYSDDQIQVTYAHPYEYPYVISVLIESFKDFDVRVIDDMHSMYDLEVDTKQMDSKILLCFYQK